ncbi:hypothetical protein ACPYO6_02525 [Georgenia sp. Z1344]|uniref:hypothetical protein n=1 Tax=Georgenia sp. Z1344 TaxID=3416706 RepID=UPI003CF09D8E
MTVTRADHGAEPAKDVDEGRLRVLVFSDDSATRREIVSSVGRRPARDVPLVDLVETATAEAVVEAVEAGGIAALVLDAEAAKEGGMSLTRRLKTSVYNCPPVLLMIARPQDRWLATWSEADAVATYPVDPRELQEALSGLLRERLS